MLFAAFIELGKFSFDRKISFCINLHIALTGNLEKLYYIYI